jgi:hypothetical protein
LEDSTEQGPVDGPSLDGFGMVGAVAVDALLADMQLPASEIGWCGFHGVGGLRLTNKKVGGHFWLKNISYNSLVVA